MLLKLPAEETKMSISDMTVSMDTTRMLAGGAERNTFGHQHKNTITTESGSTVAVLPQMPLDRGSYSSLRGL